MTPERHENGVAPAETWWLRRLAARYLELMHRSSRIVRARAGLVAAAAPVVLVGCGGAAAGGGGTGVATEAEWQALLELLAARGRLPAWNDPVGADRGSGANADGPSRVSTEALRHFLRGLAAEDTWDWEGARRGYQQALTADPDFHEARTALARAARLRLGGTLAES